MAELFEHLPGAVKVNDGSDPRGDRAVRQHLPDSVQPLRRDQGIRAGRVVVRDDLPLGEPAFVGREDGRDKATARPDDLGVALDGVGATTNGYDESAFRRPRRLLSSGLTPAKRTRTSTASSAAGTGRLWTDGGSPKLLTANARIQPPGGTLPEIPLSRRGQTRLLDEAAGLRGPREVRVPWRHWSRALRPEASHGGQ
jgi:hypothetical protein